MKNGFLDFRAKSLSSELCNSSNQLKPSLTLREDLVLIKSSQDISGQNNLIQRDQKHHLPRRKFNETKKIIESPHILASPVDDFSILKAINRKKSSTSVAAMTDETHEIEQIFQKKLNDIMKLKQDLQRSDQQDRNYLRMLLQMPNVHRSLFFLSKISHRLKKEKGFRCWKLNVAQMKYSETQKIRRHQQILSQTQRLWNDSHARESLYLRRARRAKEQQLQFDSAAQLIQKIFFFYRKNKERSQKRSRQLQQEQRFRRETAEIVKIQRAYRGWRGRCLYCDHWRVHLLQGMRQWAHGNVQKLFERSSMQDPRVYQALLKAIAICSHHSRPLRLLPSLVNIKKSYVVRHCRPSSALLISPPPLLPFSG
jgi:hypothetical protein